MNPHVTLEGYIYYRCRAAGSDDTVYEHQLVAIAEGADPREVFNGHHVHHRNGVPWDNRPSNLEVRDPRDHGLKHRRDQLAGRSA